MKITKRLREIYDEGEQKFSRLGQEVQATLKPRVEAEEWFYLDRIKKLESFALKVETGRLPDEENSNPMKLEDFYACTIVVPTINHIKVAEDLVLTLYDPHCRRPKDDNNTHKRSCSFEFDDLRLYVKRRSLSSGKDEDLTGLVFEVQIKTILQHAWSIATHDLIYKSNTVSWPRERIAYQVKAMLELAEISIAEVHNLSNAQGVLKQDAKTVNIVSIITQVNAFWPEDSLPDDIKRLAETILNLLTACSLKPQDLTLILNNEKNRLGVLPTNLSPYSFALQALAQKPELNFEHILNKNKKLKIVVHSGMELPDWFFAAHPSIINVK